MSKTINITAKDYVEFSDYGVNRAYCNKTNSSGFLRGLVMWVAIFLVFLLGFYLNSNMGGFQWYSAGVGALLPTVFLVSFVITMSRMRHACMPDPDSNLFRTKTLELKPEGVRWADDLQECFYAWEGFSAVEEHQGSVYLFLDKVMALIVPAATFADDAEREEFLAQIQHHRTEVKSLEPR